MEHREFVARDNVVCQTAILRLLVNRVMTAIDMAKNQEEYEDLDNLKSEVVQCTDALFDELRYLK